MTFEFLMVLPFIFVLLYLMVEGVVIALQWTSLDNAVREGARYAAVGHQPADIQACVVSWSGNNLSTGNVTVTGDGPSGGVYGGTVTVKVHNYSYNFTSGLLGLAKSISLSPQASTQLESSASSSNGNGSTCG